MEWKRTDGESIRHMARPVCPVASLLLIAWSFVLVGSGASAQERGPTWIPLTFDETAAPIDNPLKGFMNYEDLWDVSGISLPYSLEYFYVPLDAVMTGASTFDWSFIDDRLAAISGRGRQAVFRVYVDFPEDADDSTDCNTANEDEVATSAVPDFLIDPSLCLTDCVPLTHYCSQDETQEGYTPDYDWDGVDSGTEPDLLQAFETFIAALATKYDGDSRVGFVQVGLVGHWGEWHTYYDEPAMASNATMEAVLQAFDDEFLMTRTLVSADVLQYDQMQVQWGTKSIGLHDDAFALTTLDTDGMLERLQNLGFDEDWQFLPIGGEVAPDLQSTVHDTCPAMNDLDDAVDAVHASWLLDAYLFEGNGSAGTPTAAELTCATASARTMGYLLYVEQAQLIEFVDRHAPFELAVRVRNAGVAPFYYEWPVELALRKVTDGSVVRSWTIGDWYLPDVLPDPTGLKDFLFTEPDPQLEAEQYTVSLRVENPMSGGRPLLFANAEQGPVWLDLGVVEVTFDGIFADGFEFSDTSRWSQTAP